MCGGGGLWGREQWSGKFFFFFLLLFHVLVVVLVTTTTIITFRQWRRRSDGGRAAWKQELLLLLLMMIQRERLLIHTDLELCQLLREDLLQPAGGPWGMCRWSHGMKKDLLGGVARNTSTSDGILLQSNRRAWGDASTLHGWLLRGCHLCVCGGWGVCVAYRWGLRPSRRRALCLLCVDGVRMTWVVVWWCLWGCVGVGLCVCVCVYVLVWVGLIVGQVEGRCNMNAARRRRRGEGKESSTHQAGCVLWMSGRACVFYVCVSLCMCLCVSDEGKQCSSALHGWMMSLKSSTDTTDQHVLSHIHTHTQIIPTHTLLKYAFPSTHTHTHSHDKQCTPPPPTSPSPSARSGQM